MPRNTIRLLRAGNDRAFARRAIFFLFTAFGILFVALGVAFSSSAIPALSQAQFGDPVFQATWERTDGPVAAGTAQRGWIWGPVPGQTLSEPFNGLPGNTHLVQYFDKGRMEINDPNADKNSPFYVTNGLLALELIS